MSPQRRSTSETRARLVETAAELFYNQGILATSVDAVVEAARLSKPTLYQYFGSKQELVEAVLEFRDRNRRAAIDAVLGSSKPPAERLLALFDWLGEWLAEDDFRGCALVNATLEITDPAAPGADIARRHKQWLTRRLESVARAAELESPRALAHALLLLVEGATAMAYLGADPAAARHARSAAAALIASHSGA